MSERQIALIGFMGSGKSSVARELARRLHCQPFDLDKVITESHGQTPGELISTYGEGHFRGLETNELRRVLEVQKDFVLALGGGAWTIEQNRILLKEANCFSVWLDVPFAVCWQRVSADNTNRPLAPSREVAERLFQTRRGTYELADCRVELQGTEPLEAVAARITDIVAQD